MKLLSRKQSLDMKCLLLFTSLSYIYDSSAKRVAWLSRDSEIAYYYYSPKD